MVSSVKVERPGQWLAPCPPRAAGRGTPPTCSHPRRTRPSSPSPAPCSPPGTSSASASCAGGSTSNACITAPSSGRGPAAAASGGSGGAAAAPELLSIMEDAARRWVSGCSEQERGWAPRCNLESWLGLMHELGMLINQAAAIYPDGERAPRYRGGHACLRSRTCWRRLEVCYLRRPCVAVGSTLRRVHDHADNRHAGYRGGVAGFDPSNDDHRDEAQYHAPNAMYWAADNENRMGFWGSKTWVSGVPQLGHLIWRRSLCPR